MGYDAMSNNASVRTISKDFGKKKKANRAAKLKQWKLDARREQWLSQGKNGKDRATGASPALLNHSTLSPPIPGQGEREKVKEKEPHAVNKNESQIQDSCSDSSSQSPTMCGDIQRKEFSNISISSGSSIESCSWSVSDAEDDQQEDERLEDGSGLDDWEAVADALYADDDHSQATSNSVKAAVDSMHNDVHHKDTHPSVGATKPEANIIRRAWRPDDAARPQTLPNLLKQRSFPLNMELHFASPRWGHHHNIVSAPSSCPICVEDFDVTDSSFLPCVCGFRVCLFCHKKILEEGDEKCPGCRKKYDRATCMGDSLTGAVMSLPGRFSRSCSMNSRY